MQLGEQIKVWREKRGLTQLQLACLINRSVTTIEKIEQLTRLPSPDTLDRICNALNVTYDKIILRDNDNP